MDLATICNSTDTAEEIHSILHLCSYSYVAAQRGIKYTPVLAVGEKSVIIVKLGG